MALLRASEFFVLTAHIGLRQSHGPFTACLRQLAAELAEPKHMRRGSLSQRTVKCERRTARGSGWRPGDQGSRKRTNAGMSRKQREISIYDLPITFWEQGGRLCAQGFRRNKPKSPKTRCSRQIQGFPQKQTQAVILLVIYRLQQKSALAGKPISCLMPSSTSLYSCERSVHEMPGQSRRHYIVQPIRGH